MIVLVSYVQCVRLELFNGPQQTLCGTTLVTDVVNAVSNWSLSFHPLLHCQAEFVDVLTTVVIILQQDPKYYKFD